MYYHVLNVFFTFLNVFNLLYLFSSTFLHPWLTGVYNDRSEQRRAYRRQGLASNLRPDRYVNFTVLYEFRIRIRMYLLIATDYSTK